MRKRKYLVAGLAGVVLSVAMSGVADAVLRFQSQQLDINTAAPKLDKKKPGPVNSLFVDVITNYSTDDGSPPPNQPDRRASNTKVYFPKDFRFNTTGLPQCDPNTGGFNNSTTESAKTLCPGSQVGSGSAKLVGPVSGITAVVTAFNGTKPEGLDRILLHSRTSAGTTTVLIGTLRPSNVGGFGKMLDVPIPTLPLNLAISDFRVTIQKRKLPIKKKKFFVMAKCSKKKWPFQAITTYDSGAPTTATDRTKCKQKKKKK